MRQTLIAIFKYCLIIIPTIACLGQNDSLYISSNGLTNECNEQLILNGINYSALDDWEFPANLFNGKEKLAEIAKAGGNAVRIEWYNNYNQTTRPNYKTSDLDSLLTRCKRLNLVPIVGLWDLTCDTSWAAFDTLITKWWIRPENLALINKHKAYLIVNICNEFAQYEWTGDTTKALNDYRTHYDSAVSKLRKAGIHVPLMIDAPDCGQNVECITKCGKQIIQSDPLKNVLFGVHAYWYYYTSNDSLKTALKIKKLIDAKIPVVFGEIADYQSLDTGKSCLLNLNYPMLLNQLKKNKLGWLGWTWFNDDCNLREMADSGNFSKLTVYGNDLVNNNSFGLKTNTVKKTCQFSIKNPLPIFTCNLQLINSNNEDCELELNYNIDEKVSFTLQESNDAVFWQDKESIILNNNEGQQTFKSKSLNTDTYFRVKSISLNSAAFYSNVLFVKGKTFPSINVFPNPSHSIIHVTALLKNSDLRIYSIAGKLVLQKAIDINGSINFDISNLAKGYYFIKNTNSFGINLETTFIKE